MIGIGIGIVVSTCIMLQVKLNHQLSKSEIEIKARTYGMEYPSEFKVIIDKEVGK